MEIFRQVGYGCGDLLMNRVKTAIRRMAHGDDPDIEAPPLQTQDFRRDEGFGQARVALEQEDDRPAHHASSPRGRPRAAMTGEDLSAIY